MFACYDGFSEEKNLACFLSSPEQCYCCLAGVDREASRAPHSGSTIVRDPGSPFLCVAHEFDALGPQRPSVQAARLLRPVLHCLYVVLPHHCCLVCVLMHMCVVGSAHPTSCIFTQHHIVEIHPCCRGTYSVAV